MKERIKNKTAEIEEFLENLEEFRPSTLEEYQKDILKKSACERLIEKTIEAIIDLSFLIAKHKRIYLPEDTSNKEIFDILEKNKIISEELCKKLHDAKGMRNIISHEYGKVNDEIVYESLKEEIIKDAKEFINRINTEIKWPSHS